MQLSPLAQLLLIIFLFLTYVVLTTRAFIFMRRERRGTHAIYPASWNPENCRCLEQFRLLIGLGLIPLWGSFLYALPSMRTDLVYGDLHIVLLILLIWISDAWVLLLLPRNWKKFGAISRSFWITFTFLILWWTTTLAATGWMIVKSITPSSDLIPGAYASRDALPTNNLIATKQSAHLRGYT